MGAPEVQNKRDYSLDRASVHYLGTPKGSQILRQDGQLSGAEPPAAPHGETRARRPDTAAHRSWPVWARWSTNLFRTIRAYLAITISKTTAYLRPTREFRLTEITLITFLKLND